jgi:hypothetical protein
MKKLQVLNDTLFWRPLLAILAVFLLAGCAVGNTYSYRDSNMALPISGDDSIGLAVVDRRPYVLSGDKPAAFIGLQRGGFGNPFNVTTESGKPLAEEVQTALASGLRKRGYSVTEFYPSSSTDADISNAIKAGNLSKNVVLVLREWKTDAMMSFGLSYDLLLEVLAANGDLLASASSQANKENLGSAGFEDANATLAKRAMESKLEALFREESIKNVLQTN